MTSFHFRAVASDGQLRTGTIHAETERLVALRAAPPGAHAGLRRQGSRRNPFEIKLPSFSGGKKRDVLFFTQELSTLLNAGVPLDRALSITAELTDRPSFRFLVQDILRVLKGGRSLADSLATHPEHFSELYINMVRAGEAGGSLAVVFERLSEFERTRDDLRSYIISSMAYPTLLVAGGHRLHSGADEFRRAAFCCGLRRVAHRDAAAHQNPAGRQQVSADPTDGSESRCWWCSRSACIPTCAPPRGRLWWDTLRLQDPGPRRRAAQSRNGAICARHGDAGFEQCSAGTIASRSPARH